MDECIINTLSYFDLFDYPLTFAEIKKYLCCLQDVSDTELHEILESISIIQEQDGFYYFLGRSQIINKRIERNEISYQKFAKAKIIGRILSFIPTIEYIGVSGSLSMNNASDGDDIDLFFITKQNTLWLTRFAVNILLSILKQKRGRRQKNIKDKICPNMFLSYDNMLFKKKRQTVYTAHELVQMRTLINKNSTYELLVHKNKWLYDYLPNIEIPAGRKSKRVSPSFFRGIIQSFEKFAYFVQTAYMRFHRRDETITKKAAFFHPYDRQTIILDMYELRYKRYKKMYEDNIWIDSDEARFYIDEKKIRILN